MTLIAFCLITFLPELFTRISAEFIISFNLVNDFFVSATFREISVICPPFPLRSTSYRRIAGPFHSRTDILWNKVHVWARSIFLWKNNDVWFQQWIGTRALHLRVKLVHRNGNYLTAHWNNEFWFNIVVRFCQYSKRLSTSVINRCFKRKFGGWFTFSNCFCLFIFI